MFAYDDAITERYPTIRAGVIHATGLSNGPSPPELPDEYRAEQRAASERLEATAIADLPQVAAWRRVAPRLQRVWHQTDPVPQHRRGAAP